MSVARLTLRFFRRELENRFAGSFTGGLWALFQPLIQLAVYSFVFVHVMKARIPGADAPGFVPFLVTALWPWFAFSEAIVRSTTVVQDNAALIGKVALPREVLVIATVATSFTVHLTGYIAILVVLALSGTRIDLAGLAPAILLFVPLFALALGFALIAASTQVFVRDLSQALPQVFMLLQFAAPIFYDASQTGDFGRWLVLNPFTFYADAFHALLLHHGEVGLRRLAIALAVAAVVLFVGHRVFRRLDPHFEDFL
ncbi:MAG: ABC transporter permease [Rhodanobacteraceae bacterium]